MTYRPYTNDELPTCLGMRVKSRMEAWSFIICEVRYGRVYRCAQSFSADDLLRDWLDLSTGQPCGVPIREKEEQ